VAQSSALLPALFSSFLLWRREGDPLHSLSASSLLEHMGRAPLPEISPSFLSGEAVSAT